MERFRSRYALVAAGITMAVGVGNLWRFPRVAAEWGGGTFLIILVLASVLWAIPLLIAESLLGSKSRLGTVGAFRDFMGRRYTWAGTFMGLVTVGILAYYTVVCAWTLYYFGTSLSGQFNEPEVNTEAIWDNLTASPALVIALQLASVLLVVLVLARGLKKGFEGVLMVAMPALFVLLVILAIRAVTLPGGLEGLRYLFAVDFADFGNAQVWLEAFTQIAFSTGAGWGLYLTYAVYSRDREDMAGNATIMTVGDLIAGLLAGITVLCTLFALTSVVMAEEALGAGNEGLAFVHFPPLFADMPGGVVFAPLFFLAFALAGLSSLVAMVELVVRNAMDMGASRITSLVVVGAGAFVLGIPSALSTDVFANQDFVWGVALLLSGLLAAIAIMKYGMGRAHAEVAETQSIPIAGWFRICITLFPVMFVALMGFWIYQTLFVFGDPWWDLLSPFSLMTMLAQWAAILVLALVLNNVLARRISAGALSGSSSSSTDARG